jgi:adenosylmethionine-8-amino-7-oxononanoate aminotransferase
MTSATIYKTLASKPIELVGGDGVWIYGSGGERILDACGGVAVSSLGHRHPRIRHAMAREAERVTWAHAGSFTCSAAEELAEFLVRRSGGLAKAQFLSGGSEAMEVALKIAYQYHWEHNRPERTIFIARKQGYHGSTLGTLSISCNRERRAMFEPLLSSAIFVSPCYAYREQLPEESSLEYVGRLAQELDNTINRIGAHRVAAFLAEPVVGSTNGAVPAVEGYFDAIKKVCNKYDVLLILDDVMSGMGRSGPLFSHLEDKVTPDIVVIGKGLAAGYQPISGYLLAHHVYEAISSGSGILGNGQTHVNHPYACSIALEVQRTIEEEHLLLNATRRGYEMRSLLKEAFKDNPFVGDVRGRGLFIGIEFVIDRERQLPFNGGNKFVTDLKRLALARELLIYPGSGTADGIHGNHVLFAPAFIAKSTEIAEIVERFVDVLKDAKPMLDKERSSIALQ